MVDTTWPVLIQAEVRIFFSGYQTSNSTLMTIKLILRALKARIPAFATKHMLYTDKVGFVLTYKDYILSPHLNIIGRLYSYIIHIPLYKRGGDLLIGKGQWN